jgi:aspartate kinase
MPREDLGRARKVMEQIKEDVSASGFNFDENIGRVSLVGAGMKTHPGVAATMFEVLAREDVNIEMISTSSIRISCVVQESDVEKAVRALHDAFELEKK